MSPWRRKILGISFLIIFLESVIQLETNNPIILFTIGIIRAVFLASFMFLIVESFWEDNQQTMCAKVGFWITEVAGFIGTAGHIVYMATEYFDISWKKFPMPKSMMFSLWLHFEWSLFANPYSSALHIFWYGGLAYLTLGIICNVYGKLTSSQPD